ncbi:MAG: hypothetical protein KJ626_00090 [Verrucomicrobia bacterium]|nr:hypothetical protein [Verrucomicrobiota bacterium]
MLKVVSIRGQRVLIVLLFFGLASSSSAFKEAVGFTQLQTRLGGLTPTGEGITVSHVETLVGTNYMPDVGNTEFFGKTFTNKTGTSGGASAHATTVGIDFYGRYSGVAPDIKGIACYEADDWRGAGFLKPGSADPLSETNRIQNHSWIATSTAKIDLTRRLDYAIDRDGFLAVVGLNNGPGPVPDLLAHSYNALSVGCSDGDHSYGLTTFDDAGRTKPELVAPRPYVSFAVPVIGGAAAMLLEKVDGTPALASAANPEVIKAILMAGATKDEFSDWDRTHSRPIDDKYGAGELNIFNSYYTLTAGRSEASSTNFAENRGWDFASLTGATSAWYFVSVPSNHVMSRFSVVLTWHREITDSNPGPVFTPVPSMANLDMFFYTATNYTPVTLLDWSTSMVDNIEHYYSRRLEEGDYAIEVRSDDAADYALAWHSMTALIPTISPAQMTESSEFQFEADVSPHVPYGIEAATNLIGNVDWVNLATNSSATNVLIFIDTNSTNLFRRFYRMIPDP